MLTDIKEKLESLTRKREDLLGILENRSTEDLTYKAAADKWSVVEVVEHLVIVDQDLLNQLSAEKPNPLFDDRSRSPKNFKTVIKVMERDIPVDVPDERAEPHGRFSLAELLSRWPDIQQKLHGRLAEISSENKDRLVWRHPFAGPLNIAETLHFIEVHFDNHMRHIDRILSKNP
jgi:hypothetical protein